MRHLLIVLILLTGPTSAEMSTAAPTIDRERITVSGISAGGQMAQQLHIAYSDLISGAGILAGGPFGCAEGSLATAMARCIGKTDGPLPVAQLAKRIRASADEGKVADPANLADDRVWLFHGAQDTIVAPEVSAAAAALYAEFIPAEHMEQVTDVQAGHSFPARGRGSACTVYEPPYVADCGYDAAGELLDYLYPGLEAPAPDAATELREVPLPGAADASLGDTAWLFVPPACEGGGKACPLHLVLHGCAQSAVSVGTDFIEQSGYLPWAGANDIVLAFPQVVPSAVNPLGCWDWWGYTGAEYLWRDGRQMKVLADWLQSLSGGKMP
jgi:poly(3-hydroxybutyrate) depolymerase